MKHSNLFCTIFFSCCITIVYAQVEIRDYSPGDNNTTLRISKVYQSTSGKSLTVARFGSLAYLGGESGVWRSDDFGETWNQPTRPQPPAGTRDADNGLFCPNVFDILIHQSDPDVVLVSTGRDARVPSKAGIYRSRNKGRTWTLVHQFQNGSATGIASRIVSAPDLHTQMFAAGQFALAKSTDGGVTWIELRPQSQTGQSIWSVAVSGKQNDRRNVYAAGSRIWYSPNDGNTWFEDPASTQLGIRVGAPSNAAGQSARTICINPQNRNILYVNMNGNIWRGDFTNFEANGRATWRQLPSTRANYAGTTASGTDYIAALTTTNDGLLYLFTSDRRTTHISVGEPVTENSWKRIDAPDVHLDPHAIDVGYNFHYYETGDAGSSGFGRIAMVSDGGFYFSTDGARTWKRGKGLTTLGLVNATVVTPPHGKTAVCMGMGDNSGFYTSNSGSTWETQDYVGGDNDACFSDPQQPNKLFVFAPRSNEKGVYYYTASPGQTPDGTYGTTQRKSIPGPPLLADDERGWNVVSSHFNAGYRPLVFTLPGQRVKEQGDFIAIRYTANAAKLLRTTKMGSITNSNDWITSETEESSGAKVFQQGPDLPAIGINVVQASGGHDAPVYYVGDLSGNKRVWKWANGMSAWEQVVPGTGTGSRPVEAIRYFADPYRPHIIYVLDRNGIHFSDNYGNTWKRATGMENALTADGAFPFVIPDDGNPGEELLRDMVFDPAHPNYRFACGPAGVFYTIDGERWDHFILTSAMPMRPNNLSYDPCERALYVATNNRGLIKISRLPPEFEGPEGGLYGVEGEITMLRVHDVGTKYGPANDQLDAEVIIKLNSMGDKAFGFKLRTDGNKTNRKGMLDVLRYAFKNNKRVRIDYSRKGCNTGEIIRVWIP